MNTHVPPILMFTRGFLGFDPQPYIVDREVPKRKGLPAPSDRLLPLLTPRVPGLTCWEDRFSGKQHSLTCFGPIHSIGSERDINDEHKSKL